MSPLPELIEDVAFASTALGAARERARVEAIAAIREMERSLLEALGGETLKGVPEISSGYAAVRARACGTKAKNLAEPLPEPRAGAAEGREVLVVTSEGKLEIARTRRAGGALVVLSRDAFDEDFLVEDVEHLANLFTRLLGEHIERSRKTAGKFARLEGIAQRISAALLLA